MKRSALKAKRDTPRRNEGRVQHGRVKPKLTDKTAEVRRFHDYVAALPCVGCLAKPVHVHHVISDGYQRLSRDHRLVLPLCPACHQDGPQAIHRIGTRTWNTLHGIEQHIEAKKIWEAWNDSATKG